MGYVTNRQGLYRTGFRPIHTDPFAATQMSGLGRTPFDPEQLIERAAGYARGYASEDEEPQLRFFKPGGLGQNQPFTKGGGYVLHGLRGLGQGPIVPNGAIVQYTGTWATSISEQADTILAQVVAALKSDGFQVISSSQSGGLLGTLVTGSFTASIQMQVVNGMGFGEPSDIASIVDHEAYTATGIMPTGSNVYVSQVPGGSAPGVVTAPSTDWSTWFQQNAMWIGLGVLGIFLVPDLLERF